MAAELLTTQTVENTSVYAVTQLSTWTATQSNVSPIWRIYQIGLNSNVLRKTLSLQLGESLTGGPTPTLYTELPSSGLALPLTAPGALLLIRGLAFVNVVSGLLVATPANTPSSVYRQTYADLFPVLTTESVVEGVLRETYYLTAICSPTKSGNTWTWPLFDTVVNLYGETSSQSIQIYPYEK